MRTLNAAYGPHRFQHRRRSSCLNAQHAILSWPASCVCPRVLSDSLFRWILQAGKPLGGVRNAHPASLKRHSTCLSLSPATATCAPPRAMAKQRSKQHRTHNADTRRAVGMAQIPGCRAPTRLFGNVCARCVCARPLHQTALSTAEEEAHRRWAKHLVPSTPPAWCRFSWRSEASTGCAFGKHVTRAGELSLPVF